MTAANLLGNIFFSAIGLAAFVYGKKAGAWRPLLLGIVLMVYPYFIGETWMMYATGIALTAGLFLFRE